jgi:hypothetical protein
LIVFFEVDLLAKIAKLLLVVGKRANVTEPKELVVSVLLSLPKTGWL